MSFDITFLPDPQNRSNADWVAYYKILLDAVSQGETVSVNGRSVQMPSMTDIQDQIDRYERKAASDSQGVTARSIGPVYIG